MTPPFLANVSPTEIISMVFQSFRVTVSTVKSAPLANKGIAANTSNANCLCFTRILLSLRIYVFNLG